MPSLPIEQKLFCYYYLKLGNVREAATKAGLRGRDALLEGQRLLSLPAARKFMQSLSGQARPRNELVCAGLERLALGESNDAISLVMAEEPLSREEIERLDLFGVSELKRVKGGGVEVKFFDRQKALERLFELEHTASGESAADSFLQALHAAGREPNDV